MFKIENKKLFFIVLTFLLPFFVFADFKISEVMYDLQDSDTDREWVEIENTGQGESLKDLRLSDKNGRHLLKSLSNETDFPANSCVVIASDVTTFKKDNPNFSGVVFESSFSLVNTGDKISFSKFIDKADTFFDSISYSDTQGGKGDGNSLNRDGNTFKPGIPSPGVCSSVGGGNTTSATSSTASSGTSEISKTSSMPPSNSTGGYPIDPQIFLKINGPVVGSVGVDVVLKADLWGIDKKPITNGRIIWSFGDGASKEGYVVSHSWNFPGEYLVVAEASSLEYNASNRMKILISEPNLEIGKYVSGVEGFIEIKNNSKTEIDLSYWILKSDLEQFVFPKNTLILSNSKAIFPSKITNILVGNNLALYYPNGTKYLIAISSVEKTVSVVNQKNLKKEDTLIASVKDAQSVVSKKSVEKKPLDSKKEIVADKNNIEKIDLSASVGNSSSSYYFILALSIMSLLCIIGVVFYGKIFEEKQAISKEADNYQIEEIDG